MTRRRQQTVAVYDLSLFVQTNEDEDRDGHRKSRELTRSEFDQVLRGMADLQDRTGRTGNPAIQSIVQGDVRSQYFTHLRIVVESDKDYSVADFVQWTNLRVMPAVRRAVRSTSEDQNLGSRIRVGFFPVIEEST